MAPKNSVYAPIKARKVVALASISQGQMANETMAQMNCPRRILIYLGNSPVRSLANGIEFPVMFVMMLKKTNRAPAKNLPGRFSKLLMTTRGFHCTSPYRTDEATAIVQPRGSVKVTRMGSAKSCVTHAALSLFECREMSMMLTAKVAFPEMAALTQIPKRYPTLMPSRGTLGIFHY